MIALLSRLDRSRWQIHLVCFCGPRWFQRIADSVSVATFPVTSFHPSAGHLAAFAHCGGFPTPRDDAHTHVAHTYSFGRMAQIEAIDEAELDAHRRAAFSEGTHHVWNCRLRQL